MHFESEINTRKQVIIFFILTYAFSWTVFAIGGPMNSLPIILLGVWGPTLMSIFLTRLFYGPGAVRALFARFKRTNVHWMFWVALILLPAAIHFTGRSLWQLYFDGVINPFFRDPAYWASAIIPSFLIAGFGEELGWRGFALPRLQRHYTPIVATIVLALVHMFWHMPTYWLGQGIHNVPFLYILLFLFPWTIIFNWLYNKSNGSLIFAVSFHAISNASLSIVRFMPLDSEVPISTDLITMTSLPAELSGPYLSVVGVYWIAAILILIFGKFNDVNTDLP